MKKTLLALCIFAASTGVNAIENGTPVNATDFPSLVEMDCTGTIIGGKWVLTARHCTYANTGGLRPVHLVGAEPHTDGSPSYKRVNAINEHRFDGTASDISLWELERAPEVDTLLFLSNEPIERDLTSVFSIYGFGQSEQKLNSATYTIDDYLHEDEELLFLRANSEATTINGDSGAPYLLYGKIVAVHNGGMVTEPPVGIEGENYHGVTATRLAYSQQWLLETIDGWHYPTIAKTATTGGRVTIEVQSLNNETELDEAYTSGDVTVVGGTCSGAMIKPFDICTYIIESTHGHEGKLILDDDEVITINKGRRVVIPPPPTPDGGDSSGGSMGFLSLLSLMGLAFIRKIKR